MNLFYSLFLISMSTFGHAEVASQGVWVVENWPTERVCNKCAIVSPELLTIRQIFRFSDESKWNHVRSSEGISKVSLLTFPYHPEAKRVVFSLAKMADGCMRFGNCWNLAIPIGNRLTFGPASSKWSGWLGVDRPRPIVLTEKPVGSTLDLNPVSEIELSDVSIRALSRFINMSEELKFYEKRDNDGVYINSADIASVHRYTMNDRELISARLKPGIVEYKDLGGDVSGPFWLTGDVHSEFNILGFDMEPIVIADFDNDSSLDVLFFRSAENLDGYILVVKNLSCIYANTWTYH